MRHSAIRVGYARAAELGIQDRFEAKGADLNQPLQLEPGAFSAVLAVDVVLHVRDRQALFSDIARLLGAADLRLLETENRTESVVLNAMGRLTAMRRHREELERLSGVPSFRQQSDYLTTVAGPAHRKVVYGILYLTEARVPGAG